MSVAVSRVAQIASSGRHAIAPVDTTYVHKKNILIVDLNNFASFPTLAVGLLTASLRKRGHRVKLLCPLAYDVPATERERAEGPVDNLKRRVNLSTAPWFRVPRDVARSLRLNWQGRPHKTTLREVAHALEAGCDAVLLSAYLQHFQTVGKIGQLAKARGVPVLLGGPMFNIPNTAKAWSALPGLTAVVGAESDTSIADMVETLCAGGDLLRFPGVVLPDGRRSPKAPPLRPLDDTPMADFTDFPWDRYPVRIVPIMTGRGCQWNRCTFCSDIISTSGRSFRTRSVQNVLAEMQEQSRRHNTNNFLFLDLKLNSYPEMLRGIAAEIQDYVPGAEWVGTVHVDLRRDNGLGRDDLKAAVKAGMRRISFGLESGSQRILDAMDKGASVERNAQFIREAHAVGLSVRCTMFKGYPGETAEDMAATAQFLEDHIDMLDRVRFNEFNLLEDTPIYREMVASNQAVQKLQVRQFDHWAARAHYLNPETGDKAYRREKARALRAVYEINRRPLRAQARQFDGLM